MYKHINIYQTRQDKFAHLSNSSLHNYEVGIVDVQLDGLEETEHRLLLNFMSIQYVFCDIRESDLNQQKSRMSEAFHMKPYERADLTRKGDLFAIFKPWWTGSAVGIVEHDRHTSLDHTRLTTLIDQVLLVLSSHLLVKVYRELELMHRMHNTR